MYLFFFLDILGIAFSLKIAVWCASLKSLGCIHHIESQGQVLLWLLLNYQSICVRCLWKDTGPKRHILASLPKASSGVVLTKSTPLFVLQVESERLGEI